MGKLFKIFFVLFIFIAISFWGYTYVTLHNGMGDVAATKCAPNGIPNDFSFEGARYYTGPLFETHLHIPSPLPPPKIIRDRLGLNQEYATLGESVTISEIVCLMERENIIKSVAFFPVLDLPFLRNSFIKTTKLTSDFYGDKIVPFVLPVPYPDPLFSPEALREIVTSKKNLYKGYGEIPFYWDEYNDIPPDSPQFLASLDVLEEQKLFAMIHPDNGQEEALQSIFTSYPNVTFILHSGETERSLGGFFEQYENVFFTLDTQILPPFNSSRSAEEFIENMKENFEIVLEDAIRNWKHKIEAHPDRYLWGTDRFTPWSFDKEAGVVMEKFFRAFIGRLDPKVQELYAYKNAERLFNDAGE